MTEFNIRSDAVDVEQIMRQIRARIREKRGIDYTEDEIRQLASVKLEKFLEPTGVRSDLVEQFRRRQPETEPPLNYGFEDDTIYASHRAVLRWFRKVLNPVLKLLFNPNPIAHVLHLQSQINDRLYTRNQKREQLDPLYFEVMHNLVLEMTKLGIEVRNLKMRVESLSSRVDFDERRARALEGVVQYKPGADRPPVEADGPRAAADEGGEERKRRLRRRRRRGGRQGGDPGQGPATAGSASGATDDGEAADAEEAPESSAAGDERDRETDTGHDADARQAQTWDEPAEDRAGDTDAEDQ